MTESEPGLRELKKQMTRASISNAALELTVEKGFDHLTIDEIARRAIVSPRTISNYFSSKEEAVISAGNEYWAHLIDSLDTRPLEEHPLRSMRTLLVEATAATDDEDLQRAIRTMRLAHQTPGLRSFQVSLYARLEASLRESVAARSGTDLQHDLYPWLIAAGALAAMKSAMSLWLINDAAPDELPKLIDAAFDQITEGLPAPAR